MLTKIIDFIKNNGKTILLIGIGLFLLYWVIYVLTPKIEMSQTEKQKIDSINIKLTELHNDNSSLEERIKTNNEQINQIDFNLNNLKGQKTIIKEYYHEKINSVDKLTIHEIDGFFTDRYKY
jgi:vacuolar-type H+-ATPase subunit I/STV1